MPQNEATRPPFPDRLTVRRVANGWVVHPGLESDEYLHIYSTPEGVAEHVERWAEAQIR